MNGSTGLTLVKTFYWILPMAARLGRLISINTKECWIGSPSWKRSINLGLCWDAVLRQERPWTVPDTFSDCETKHRWHNTRNAPYMIKIEAKGHRDTDHSSPWTKYVRVSFYFRERYTRQRAEVTPFSLRKLRPWKQDQTSFRVPEG